ncbi:Aquaporin TIP4-3 [Porphyridium purpureum]|uniref:Aquaporin TIP4-3 n=1 Tax=Porphyridium purpureum TaxID=35688 RepID=A0A5J4Z645_PORPP|nr:Aquaporin TIP4-3 [Porphyridium purpureum]|eukprot:POR3208..scf295_1
MRHPTNGRVTDQRPSPVSLHGRSTNEPSMSEPDAVGPRYTGGLLRTWYSPLVESDVYASPSASSAARFTTLQQVLGAQEFRPGGGVYRGSLIELIGTCIFVYVHIGIVRAATLFGAFAYPPLIMGIVHAILLSLFIFTTAAPSGGHLNPSITLATTFTGHTTLFRCGMYLSAQIVGGILGAVLMRVSLGWHQGPFSDAEMAVCSFGSLSVGSAFMAEVVWTFALLFVAFGIAFDPRQAQLFGPIMAPVFIGTQLGINIFASASLSVEPGYVAGMNFAVCLGPAVAVGRVPATTWVYFLGPMVAAAVLAVVFISAPPHHAKHGFYRPPLLCSAPLVGELSEHALAQTGS